MSDNGGSLNRGDSGLHFIDPVKHDGNASEAKGCKLGKGRQNSILEGGPDE
jgi:hypothetical protein